MFLGIASGLCAGALWGLVFLAPKLLDGYSPADIALGRYAAFGFLSCILLLRRARHIRPLLKPSVVLNATVLSCLSFSLYYFALAASIKYSGVAPATFIIALLPITIPLVSHDKIIRRGFFYLSLVMTLGGLVLLNSPLFSDILGTSIPSTHWLMGLILAAVACALWTAYAPLNTQFMMKHPEIDSALWASLLGIFALITMLPIWLWLNADHLMASAEHLLAWPYVGWMVVIGIGSSWLATYFWNFACRRIPTALAGQLIVSEAIFSLIYNYVDEWTLPPLHEFIAAVFLIAGVAVGIQAFSNKKGAPTQ